MNAEIDDILERVLCGDLSEDSPEFQQACSNIPDLRARLARLKEVCATLDAAAVEERAGFARELADTRFESAERAYADSLRAQMSVRRGSNLARNFAIAAAAAAIVTVSYFALHDRGFAPTSPGARGVGDIPTRPGSGTLGNADEVTPNLHTVQDEYRIFDWSRLRPKGAFYILTIYSDDGRAHEIWKSEELEDMTCTPPVDNVRDWPDHIYYALEVFDGAGNSWHRFGEAVRSR